MSSNYKKVVIDISKVLKIIKNAGLKLTKQRIELVHLLYGKGHRHISAEVLHSEALENGIKISLGTVYNTLRFLYDIGLVNEIKIFSNSVFDTNCHDHAHILDETTGDIKDLFFDDVYIKKIKQECQLTQGIKGVDILFKLETKQ